MANKFVRAGPNIYPLDQQQSRECKSLSVRDQEWADGHMSLAAQRDVRCVLVWPGLQLDSWPAFQQRRRTLCQFQLQSKLGRHFCGVQWSEWVFANSKRNIKTEKFLCFIINNHALRCTHAHLSICHASVSCSVRTNKCCEYLPGNGAEIVLFRHFLFFALPTAHTTQLQIWENMIKILDGN